MNLSYLRYLTIPFFVIKNALILRKKRKNFGYALDASMEWLCKAQDQSGEGGISLGYDLRKGWEPAFPETTGYIVSTFFNYFYFTNNSAYRERALYMLEWLCQVQEGDGPICGIMKGAQVPLVFDTGQVLFGFLRGFLETQNIKYLERALCAGDWLVSVQDEDGKWSRHEFLEQIHTYNTRVAWALMELAQITGKKQYQLAAEKNIDWAILQQNDNGWYANNAFSIEQPVFTHTIAYATRGILECGLLNQNHEWIMRAQITADALLLKQRKDGSLAGSYDGAWEPTSRSSCLTGNAQMAIIWLRFFQFTGEKKYLLAAERAISFLVQSQERSRIFPWIHGAIAGSKPIYGSYLPFVYPNWASKFFADAILLYLHVTQNALAHVKHLKFY